MEITGSSELSFSSLFRNRMHLAWFKDFKFSSLKNHMGCSAYNKLILDTSFFNGINLFKLVVHSHMLKEFSLVRLDFIFGSISQTNRAFNSAGFPQKPESYLHSPNPVPDFNGLLDVPESTALRKANSQDNKLFQALGI